MRASAALAASTLAAGLLVSVGPSEAAHAAPACAAVDHRASGGPNIDDNSLAGLLRDRRHGYRSEVDARAIRGGTVLFHNNLWQQGTTGRGIPEQTTVTYAKRLVTLPHRQQVPTLVEAGRLRSKMLIEFHKGPFWTRARIAAVVTYARRHDLLRLWWFTGTKTVLDRLGSLRTDVITVFRHKRGKPDLTRRQVRRYDVEILAVPTDWTLARVRANRARGLRVIGNGTWNEAAMQRRIEQHIYTAQVPTPTLWVRYCRSHR